MYMVVAFRHAEFNAGLIVEGDAVSVMYPWPHLSRPWCGFDAAVGDRRASHQTHVADLAGVDPAGKTKTYTQNHQL